MSRSVMFVGLAMLTIALSTAGVSAEDTGGIAFMPEVLAADNAQERVLDQVAGSLLQFQQLHFFNLPSGAIANSSSNPANPAVPPFGSGLHAIDSAFDALSQADALRRTRGE